MFKHCIIQIVIYMIVALSAVNITYAAVQDTQLNTAIYSADEKINLRKLKDLALEAAAQNNDVLAAQYAEIYTKESQNTGFLKNESFDVFQKDSAFEAVKEKYLVRFGMLPLFYLFCSLIGFFIAFVLLFKNSGDFIATLLISIFLALHSSFIFHIFLYVTNLKYEYPHILLMTAGFSYLYAPLIYFYYKRFTSGYKFRKIDTLHLIPTVLVFVFLIPIYNFSGTEKMAIMFESSLFNVKQYLPYLMFTKLVSLILYGAFTLKEYMINKGGSVFTDDAKHWQRNFVYLGLFYTVSYAIYGLTIIEVLPRFDFIYHLQIIAMSAMVLYIGVMATLKSNVFNVHLNKAKNKYEKSGLTPAYSLELKDQLIALLETKKIYRENSISLGKVASILDVSRHNASQVINEHFGFNFFELINQYRIEEALSLLENYEKSESRIIDIAYSVGFNNKVTFNKSFKKIVYISPSAYLKELKAV